MTQQEEKTAVGSLKELSAALRRQEGPIFAILDALGEGVSVQDLDLRIMYANQALRDRLGSKLSGRHCYEVHECRETPCDDGCPLQEAFQTGLRASCVRKSTNQEGASLVFEVTAAPLADAAGNIVAGLVVARDITDETEAQEDLEAKSKRLQRLAAVAKQVSSGLDPSLILRRVLETAAELTGADAGTVAILDEESRKIIYPHHFNMPAELSEVVVPEGKGLAGEVMRTGRPVMLDDYSSHPAQLPAFTKAGVKSILAAPLMIGKRPVGAIGLFGKTEGKIFTDEDAETIRAVADQAAVAIDNARMFEEISDRLFIQGELTKAAMSISSELDIDATLNQVARYAAEVLKADAAMIALWEDAREVVNFPYAYNLPEQLTQVVSPGDHGIASRVIKTCKPVIANDYRSHPDRRAEFVQAGIRAVASVPLQVGGHCVGAIGVMDTGKGRVFREEDLDILAIISTQAAVAVENARLYEELASSAQKLEQRVRERTDALSRMYRESERKSRQLEEANLKLKEVDELKSDFLANMSHELRTPLNSIIGFSKLILEGLDGEVNDEQRRDLEIINQNGEELLSLIDDVLNLAKIEAGRVPLSKTEAGVDEIARMVVMSFGSAAAGKGLRLELEVPERLRPISVDQGKIRQVLMNLVGNAIKFTEEGSVIITLEQTPRETKFLVRDTGVGISSEDINKVFDRFHQVRPGLAQAGGVGLGLTISKRFVEMHGGDIWVESELGQGSTFAFSIPEIPGETRGAGMGV